MTTSHKLKLKNVKPMRGFPRAWKWDVYRVNGEVWHCETGYLGDDVWRVDDNNHGTRIACYAGFTLAGCTRAQVYRRIHKVFDKMKVPK